MRVLRRAFPEPVDFNVPSADLGTSTCDAFPGWNRNAHHWSLECGKPFTDAGVDFGVALFQLFLEIRLLLHHSAVRAMFVSAYTTHPEEVVPLLQSSSFLQKCASLRFKITGSSRINKGWQPVHGWIPKQLDHASSQCLQFHRWVLIGMLWTTLLRIFGTVQTYRKLN